MLQISEKKRDLMGFGALLVFFALFLAVPHEIPKEIQGDFPADIYPRTLLIVALGLLILQVGRILLTEEDKAITFERHHLKRSAVLFLVMIGGYLIILLSGFVLAGGFFIFCFAWLLKERNRGAVALALAVPLFVYWCLEYAFRIRLPSIFDAL